MEFRVLGPLELSDDDGRLVELPAGKPRVVLGLLLLEAGSAVSVDRIVDAVWGERPPATAAKVVQGYVSRLRKLLPGRVLETRAPGYRLRLGDEQLDLRNFERLRQEAAVAAAEGRHDEAAARLASALALWRGPALADVADELRVPGEPARLDELRLATLEERIDADLALGREAQLVGELEALVAQHPLRERLRYQLMLALYRVGRQADALAAYQDARTALIDELGLEPTRSLQELEKAILLHDPSLEPAVATASAVTAPTPSRRPAGVRLCAECGASNPRGAQYCQTCGATLAVGSPLEARKVVTVFFADVVGSTVRGEALEPEAPRRVMERYFGEARSAIVGHGGSVEKFVGDAVMAVFGVPALHEDDALRAVRAASELRARLAALNWIFGSE